MYELVFMSGPRAGEVIPVTGTMIAGREQTCDLHTPDPSASRRHARLTFDGFLLHVTDQASANGTFVGDRRITTTVTLNAGDLLRIGETRLKVRRRAASDRSHSNLVARHATDPAPSQTLQVSLESVAARMNDAVGLRLQAVLDVSQALVSIESLEATSAAVLDALFRVFPQADRAFLMLGSQASSLIAQAFRVRGHKQAEAPSVSSGILQKVLESRSALLFNDQDPGDIDTSGSISKLQIRSAMAVPLVVGAELLGLLQVDTADLKRAFAASDLDLAVALGRQAAVAVRSAALVARVETETRTRDNLLRFLPGPLVEQALAGRLDLSLGGRTYLATILFSDLVGFTALSERLPPEDVVALMNRYFDRMVPCIDACGGSVDKFIGDAILAVWGIPAGRGDAAHGACQAALAMQTALLAFNSLQAESSHLELAMRLGVNTGPVVAGNVGTETRKEYTVLGDAVNTAERLEASAASDQVVVSASTWAALNGAGRGFPLPPLAAKNKAAMLDTYSLRGLVVDNEVALHLPVSSAGRAAWIIRCLADGSFVVLHPDDCDLDAAPLVSAASEWTGVDLGTPREVAALPAQAAEGRLVRSQVRLPEGSLHGLLPRTPP